MLLRWLCESSHSKRAARAESRARSARLERRASMHALAWDTSHARPGVRAGSVRAQERPARRPAALRVRTWHAVAGNRSDSSAAGSPRTVSGRGVVGTFEHACRSQRDRARSTVWHGCITAFRSHSERVFHVFLISGEPGFVRRLQNRRERRPKRVS